MTATWQPGSPASKACRRRRQRSTGSCRCVCVTVYVLHTLVCDILCRTESAQTGSGSAFTPLLLPRCCPQMADAVDAMADDFVRFRMFSVTVRQAKYELMSRALAARHALQRWVQEQWHARNTAQITRCGASLSIIHTTWHMHGQPVDEVQHEGAHSLVGTTWQA